MFTTTEQIHSYLNYCKYNKEHTDETIKTKYYHLTKFVRDVGVGDLRCITNDMVDDWKAFHREDGMAKKSINNYIDDVVGCTRYLRDKRQQPVVLRTEGLDRYRIRYDNEDLPSFSPEEITRIKESCVSLLESIVFSLIFESAMRLHEITYLCIEDIREDDERQYFRITGKGGARRNTFILPDTQKMLQRWLMLAGVSESWIFPSPVRDGLPYTNEQMRKIITRPIRRAGFEIGGPHAIRRSSISIALDSGMPLAKVAKWAGHSDPRITLKHYYKYNNKLMQDDHRKAMEKSFK